MLAGKISKYSILAVASGGGATENSCGSRVRLERQKTRSRKGGVDSRSTLSAAEGWSAIVELVVELEAERAIRSLRIAKCMSYYASVNWPEE